MTLHISAVSSLMTVLVTSALAFTDLAGGAAGIAKSAPAYGEWVKVDTIEISEAIVYAEDPSTLHREGHLVKMWALFDYQTQRRLHGGPLALSSKNQYEYECAGKRQRLLANMWFSGHMGSGEIVHQFADAQPWTPVMPEGPEHSLWIAACSDNLSATGSQE